MQAMTSDSALAQSRIGLGDIILKDSQNADNSLATRYSCAFDALYLYALAILGAPKDLQSHPYLELLSEGAARLGLNPQALEPVLERMDRLFGPLEASEEEVFALIELAQEARQRLG
jgi:hypothetical protein